MRDARLPADDAIRVEEASVMGRGEILGLVAELIEWWEEDGRKREGICIRPERGLDAVWYLAPGDYNYTAARRDLLALPFARKRWRPIGKIAGPLWLVPRDPE